MGGPGGPGGPGGAYQQASTVTKPPAAVLSRQHEGESLTAAKDKCIHMRNDTKTHDLNLNNSQFHTDAVSLKHI